MKSAEAVKTTEAQVFAVVREATVSILGIDSELVAMDRSLRDLGANSLDRAEIVTLTLEKLGLHLSPRDLSQAGNIGGLVRILHARLTA